MPPINALSFKHGVAEDAKSPSVKELNSGAEQDRVQYVDRNPCQDGREDKCRGEYQGRTGQAREARASAGAEAGGQMGGGGQGNDSPCDRRRAITDALRDQISRRPRRQVGEVLRKAKREQRLQRRDCCEGQSCEQEMWSRRDKDGSHRVLAGLADRFCQCRRQAAPWRRYGYRL
jgi:hypothetical protein